jgi:hypothetical protein
MLGTLPPGPGGLKPPAGGAAVAAMRVAIDAGELTVAGCLKVAEDLLAKANRGDVAVNGERHLDNLLATWTRAAADRSAGRTKAKESTPKKLRKSAKSSGSKKRIERRVDSDSDSDSQAIEDDPIPEHYPPQLREVIENINRGDPIPDGFWAVPATARDTPVADQWHCFHGPLYQGDRPAHEVMTEIITYSGWHTLVCSRHAVALLTPERAATWVYKKNPAHVGPVSRGGS